MSQDQLAALFQHGIQFNVNDLQAGQGSGLGLFISKGFVKQHNGDLEVSSRGLGCGSTFTCSLPLYEAPQSFTETTSMNSQASPPVDDAALALKEEKIEPLPLRILIVDDIGTNRKLLKRLAVNYGHSADVAKDGREAVEQVVNVMQNGTMDMYDTILMDYEMPVLRGPEAVKEIRELGCDSFIVGITGNVLAEDVSYFIACGADFVLPKPVDFRKLEELWVEHGVTGAARHQ
jgi:CheY-like chemotaxis protein